MKFCTVCGTKTQFYIPEGDNRERHVCPACGNIDYINPKVVVGSLPVWEDKVLLCKRAIEPRYGYWTLPAGFMECDETTQVGAMRETQEEANADIEIQQLYCVFNLPHVDQVYMMFRAKLLNLDFAPGAESLEVKLFKEEEIPWDELAFATIDRTLKLFFQERNSENVFSCHFGDIKRQGSGAYEYLAFS